MRMECLFDLVWWELIQAGVLTERPLQYGLSCILVYGAHSSIQMPIVVIINPRISNSISNILANRGCLKPSGLMDSNPAKK